MSEYRNILVTTDYSDQSLPALAEAHRLAAALGSRLTLLYVVEDRLPPLLLAAGAHDRDQRLESHRKTAEGSLADFAREHLPGAEVSALVRVGEPSAIIRRTADEEHADLIVIASHGYGTAGQVLFGSTAQRVVHHAGCPVVVVRSR